MPRNFVATVKESPGEAPLEVHFETSDDIGTGMRTVALRLQPETSLEDARALAATLKASHSSQDDSGRRFRMSWLP